MQNIIQIKLPQNPDNAPFVNTYLIKNQRILIDAGPANLQAYQILKQTLNDNQIDFNSLNGIFITHHHLDHIGMLKLIPQTVPLIADPTIAYFSSKEYLNDIIKFTNSLRLPNKVSQSLQNKLRSRYCPFIKRFKIINPHSINIFSRKLTGHSNSDYIFGFNQYLFTGDLVLKGIYFNKLTDIDPVSRNFLKNQSQLYIDSLEKISNNQTEVFLPGHGEIMQKEQLIQIINKNLKLITKHQQLIQKHKFENYTKLKKLIFPSALKIDEYYYLSELMSFL